MRLFKKKEKRKKLRITEIVRDNYKNNKRSSLIVYFVLRILVVICMILQLIRGDINNALLCLLSLVLLFLPLFIQEKLRITLPNTLEIVIYLFIFSAEILGEINNFYGLIPYWDAILHTLNGFLATAVGFSMVDLLNTNSKKFNLSPIYLCMVAFCFSMTIGVLWEFLKYNADKFLHTDMQKDTIVQRIDTVSLDESKSNKVIKVKDIDKTILYDKDGKVITTINGGYLDIGIIDTMDDLMVNFIGAVVFCFFGYFYLLKNKDKGIISNFVPTKGYRNSDNKSKKLKKKR